MADRLAKMTRDELIGRVEALETLVDQPGVTDFLVDVQREAAHQLLRWGPAHDRNKTAADWFWLVGYLAGQALHAETNGDQEKARHHTISTGAALFHWFAAIATEYDPSRRSDVEELINKAFSSAVAATS